MGVLTDIIVARSADAEAILETELPSASYPGFDAKGLDEAHLAALLGVLGDGDAGDDWADSLEPLAQADAEGPWLFELPGELVTQLARLPDGEHGRVAAAWGKTDECGEWAPELVQPMLEGLVKYARQATDEGKQLLMWISL
jgi:hypothetical protein